MASPQRYEILADGVHHGLEVTSLRPGQRRLSYFLDGREIARQVTPARDTTITSHREAATSAIRVRLSGSRVRRATLELRDPGAADSLEGPVRVDLLPAPGTRARRLWSWGQQHPFLYALRHVLTGDLGLLLLVLLGGGLIDRATAWAGRETKPATDALADALPDIPLPSVPWPDWRLPDWARPLWHVLDLLAYAWPVLLGLALAGLELRRAEGQRELRRRLGNDV